MMFNIDCANCVPFKSPFLIKHKIHSTQSIVILVLYRSTYCFDLNSGRLVVFVLQHRTRVYLPCKTVEYAIKTAFLYALNKS